MSTPISNYDDVIDSRAVIARLEELQDEQNDLAKEVQDERQSMEIATDEAEQLEAEERLTDAEYELGSWEDDNLEELEALTELAREGADYAADWEYGETLIRDSYFEQYAQELAEDIGAIDRNANWPLGCIDWEQAARELQQDYTQIDFGGVVYWIR